jgi:hypothetical protein
MKINEKISQQIFSFHICVIFRKRQTSERDKGSFYCYPTYLNYPDKNKQED